jgi:hypothetical protein
VPAATPKQGLPRVSTGHRFPLCRWILVLPRVWSFQGVLLGADPYTKVSMLGRQTTGPLQSGSLYPANGTSERPRLRK